MEIIPLGPGFAAELRGVTLAEVAAKPPSTTRSVPLSRNTRC